MNCDRCNAKMLKTTATESHPYQYKAGGLQNVNLCGISIHKCANCDLDAPVIPKIASLHRVIATELVKKSQPLTGGELRFLRKNAGLPAKNFAALLGIDPSHLSRVENGKRLHLSESGDKLARICAAVSICGEEARDAIARLGKRLAGAEKKGKAPPVIYALKGENWQRAA